MCATFSDAEPHGRDVGSWHPHTARPPGVAIINLDRRSACRGGFGETRRTIVRRNPSRQTRPVRPACPREIDGKIPCAAADVHASVRRLATGKPNREPAAICDAAKAKDRV